VSGGAADPAGSSYTSPTAVLLSESDPRSRQQLPPPPPPLWPFPPMLQRWQPDIEPSHGGRPGAVDPRRPRPMAARPGERRRRQRNFVCEGDHGNGNACDLVDEGDDMATKPT
jgi:hypothetical protein